MLIVNVIPPLILHTVIYSPDVYTILGNCRKWNSDDLMFLAVPELRVLGCYTKHYHMEGHVFSIILLRVRLLSIMKMDSDGCGKMVPLPVHNVEVLHSSAMVCYGMVVINGCSLNLIPEVLADSCLCTCNITSLVLQGCSLKFCYFGM